MTPVQAFYSGLGKPSKSKLPLWVSPVITMVTDSWDGNNILLEELGQAYKRLDERGHYFSHHQYVNDFIRNNFLNGNMRFSTNALLSYANADAKRKERADYLVNMSKTTVELKSNVDVLSLINSLMERDHRYQHDANNAIFNGIISYVFIWYVLPQSERAAFVEKLIELLDALPSAEKADPNHVVIYSDSCPAPKDTRLMHNIKMGSRILLATHITYFHVSDYYSVINISENYTVLENEGKVLILDWANSSLSTHTNSQLFPITVDAEKNEEVLNILEDELNPDNTQRFGLTLNNIGFYQIQDILPPADKTQYVAGTKVKLLTLLDECKGATGSLICAGPGIYRIDTSDIRSWGDWYNPWTPETLKERTFSASQLLVAS
jgi:hypothetical protein